MTQKFTIGEDVILYRHGERIRCMVRALRENGQINVMERFPRVHDVNPSEITKDDGVIRF